MATERYYFECPLSTCRGHADCLVAPSDYPWCNKDSHSKKMVFVPEKSTGTPKFIK